MPKDKAVNLNFKKTIQINDALKKKDLSGLKQLGRAPGGFLSSDVRKRVWPRLIDVNGDAISERMIHSNSSNTERDAAIDRFSKQQRCEVSRKQVHGGTTESAAHKYAVRGQDDDGMTTEPYSTAAATTAAVSTPELGHSPQGCADDILAVLVLLFGENQGRALMDMVRRKYTRYPFDCHDMQMTQQKQQPTTYITLDSIGLTATNEVAHQMASIDLFVQRQHPDSRKHMARSFSQLCLCSAMRWFTDMEDPTSTRRLFDLFLCYDHPWMPLYFAAALAMAQRGPRDIMSADELEALVSKAVELEHAHRRATSTPKVLDVSRVLHDPALMVVASMVLLAFVPSGVNTLR